MNSNFENLVKLMKENPELPVVPLVDAEICGDEYASYIGSWGHVKVEEYIVPKNGDCICFKSDNDVMYTLERCLSDEEFQSLPESEDECKPYYDALPWKKAIVVYIDVADEEQI